MKLWCAIAVMFTLTLCGAYSAEAPCIKEAAFEKGGRLVRLTRLDFSTLPYNFTCDFVPCYGVVVFNGVVDERGHVIKVVAGENSWEVSPSYHANTLASYLRALRYSPPIFKGKGVCVEKRWEIGYSPAGMEIFR